MGTASTRHPGAAPTDRAGAGHGGPSRDGASDDEGPGPGEARRRGARRRRRSPGCSPDRRIPCGPRTAAPGGHRRRRHRHHRHYRQHRRPDRPRPPRRWEGRGGSRPCAPCRSSPSREGCPDERGHDDDEGDDHHDDVGGPAPVAAEGVEAHTSSIAGARAAALRTTQAPAECSAGDAGASRVSTPRSARRYGPGCRGGVVLRSGTRRGAGCPSGGLPCPWRFVWPAPTDHGPPFRPEAEARSQ